MSRSRHRIRSIIEQSLRDFRLDLSGLVVYTEAASGAYLHTPILAAMAGARRVIARTRDSRFLPGVQVERLTLDEARSFGVAHRIEVVHERRRDDLAAADIVTNTGFVRPIDDEVVEWLKPTAVIPLMWETWEFRPEDLALEACRRKGILVLGTDESAPPLSMDPYAGMLALKLLFDLRLEGYRTRVLLVGGDRLGRRIAQCFEGWGISCRWFADGTPGADPLAGLPEHWAAAGGGYDALLIAELRDRSRILGGDGLLAARELARVNPDLRVGVIAGNVDAGELAASGLAYLPESPAPPGYMAYQLYDMGPRPILELFTAGLKVGEAMARARLSGATVEESARDALASAPAMDFQGGVAWL